ncbi:MAG: agmatine deiminase family protein [Paracoccaceae bacterium]|nr:agmatine deiminase family protein [Paracoccaceae bacterium]
MPARFDTHERTLVTWPPVEEGVGTDVPGFRNEIESMVRSISRFEPVTLLADPKDVAEATKRCGDVAEIFEVPVDACWIRDNGPIFVRNVAGEVAGVHFGFNGWGERCVSKQTQKMPPQIVQHLGMACFSTPFIGEGGGMSVDGEGTLITTEQNMRNVNRYAGMSKATVERHLHDYLGIEKVIWLPLGLYEDAGTDGHVDNVVEFFAPGKVIAQTCDKSNPNFDLLQENLDILKSARDAKGRQLDILELDVIPYATGPDGSVCAIPYTNAYVVNGGLIAPEVDPKLDDRGFDILQQAYPGREIATCRSEWQAVGGGGIGCVTQQVPVSKPQED